MPITSCVTVGMFANYCKFNFLIYKMGWTMPKLLAGKSR